MLHYLPYQQCKLGHLMDDCWQSTQRFWLLQLLSIWKRNLPNRHLICVHNDYSCGWKYEYIDGCYHRLTSYTHYKLLSNKLMKCCLHFFDHSERTFATNFGASRSESRLGCANCSFLCKNPFGSKLTGR